MTSEKQKTLNYRLCPHRGIGKENTLDSIQAGIAGIPLMVEFDVQLYRNKLHLGHPPDINTGSGLNDALQLFLNTSVLPKIDLKLNQQTSSEALAALTNELTTWSPRRALVNISGALDSNKFMEAESKLINDTKRNVLLNIDLERYKHKSTLEISKHVNNLNRRPFSLSPNLDTDINHAINFAVQHKIPHIHFWSYNNQRYELDYLLELMELVLSHGLEVYFDISHQNIFHEHRSTFLRTTALAQLR